MPEQQPHDPALVLRRGDPDRIGTHVLVVGMGTYPHLVGGSEQDATVAEGMGQLPPAPASARELARWFVDRFDNPDRPLASLAMVLSEPQPAQVTVEERDPVVVPEGTFAQTGAAIAAWLLRAAVNPGNQAVFAFCGHGVAYGDGLLMLCRDYGAVRGARFAAAVNLTQFASAMQTWPIGFQLFLVDACRAPTSLERNVVGRPNLGSSAIDPCDPHTVPMVPLRSVHVSCGEGGRSYGSARGTTLFNRALIRALDGGGAQPELGYWVGTSGLQAACNVYVRRMTAGTSVIQMPELLRSASFRIHRPADIVVPLHVTCEPETGIQSASLEVSGTDRPLVTSAPGTRRPGSTWSVRLPMDKYAVRATFGTGGAWQDTAPETVHLVPPEVPCELRLSRRRP